MKASVMKSTLAGILLLTTGPVFSEAAKQPDPMQEMQKTMQQIRDTKDSDKRMELMQKHMDQMHAAMAQMHSMMGNKDMAAMHGKMGDHNMANCQGHMTEMQKMMQDIMGQMDAEKQEMKKTHDHARMRGAAQ